jgi:hypothetical protein
MQGLRTALTNGHYYLTETGCMPVQLKEAMLKPKLKKSNLEFEEYSNFRPISNLKFLPKIIEKAVATQFMEHLVNNNLEEPLQSAYKRFHSTEMALLKVQNDILIAIDNQKCVRSFAVVGHVHSVRHSWP